MTKWEYVGLKVPNSAIVAGLNHGGKDGWDIVMVLEQVEETTTFLMKRPAPLLVTGEDVQREGERILHRSS